MVTNPMQTTNKSTFSLACALKDKILGVGRGAAMRIVNFEEDVLNMTLSSQEIEARA